MQRFLATGVVALVLPGVAQAQWADPADSPRTRPSTTVAEPLQPTAEFVRAVELRVEPPSVVPLVDSPPAPPGLPSGQSKGGRWSGAWPPEPAPVPERPTAPPSAGNVRDRAGRLNAQVTVRVDSNAHVTVRVDSNAHVTVRVGSPVAQPGASSS